MKNHNFTGIVLKKRVFMESDLIVTVLTKAGLRQEFVVKGGNGRSKRRSHLELLNQVRGTFYEGKKHKYLQDIQAESSFSRLKDDLDKIMRMQVLTEIIEKSLPIEDPHPEIYSLLEESLHNMNQADAEDFTLEHALIRLAHCLGFLPSFKHCSQCHRAILEDTAQWNASANTLHCHPCGTQEHQHFPLKYRKAMELFRQAPHSILKNMRLQEEEARTLHDFILKLFSNQLERPIHSLKALTQFS